MLIIETQLKNINQHGDEKMQDLDFQTIAPVALIILSALFLLLYIKSTLEIRASETWPIVEGTITKSEVRTTLKVGDVAEDESPVKHELYLWYRFVVDGKEYKSHRVKIGGVGARTTTSQWGRFLGSSTTLDDVVAKYPEDKIIDVHYNPNKPQQCVLEPGGNVLISLIVALFFFSMAFVIFFFLSPQ